MRIHFYLEDGTVEILEDYKQNSGREHFPVFLQRCQLPKVGSSLLLLHSTKLEHRLLDPAKVDSPILQAR